MPSVDEILRAALNAIGDPIFILDDKRVCRFANDAFTTFLKIQAGTCPETNSFWTSASDYKKFQEELTVEFLINSTDSCLVKLEVNTLSVDKGFHIFRILSALSKSDPATSFHSQRLETLGILAGAVAHDFNNILTGILGHTTYLKTILPQSGPHVESLTAIEHGTRKGSSITQHILNFSKIDSSTPVEPVVLAELVGSTCSLLRRSVPSQISLKTVFTAPEARVICNEAHIAQMVVNLVINARDAIKGSGQITVEITAERDLKKLTTVFNGLDLSSEEYAVIRVEDTGHGISDDLIPRIFEPYFSTKKGKGTGLGLATVASIVRSLGGAVVVDSQVDSGTRIDLYLPSYSSPEAATKGAEETGRKLQRGTESILVVDDEYPVRNVLVVSLQHLGYRVEAAASGKEALEIFSRDPKQYHLVISDMLMPTMTGEQLFYQLKELSPDVRVLLISGYTSEESIRNALAHGAVGFVPKPFTIEDLSVQVRKGLTENLKK